MVRTMIVLLIGLAVIALEVVATVIIARWPR